MWFPLAAAVCCERQNTTKTEALTADNCPDNSDLWKEAVTKMEEDLSQHLASLSESKQKR